MIKIEDIYNSVTALLKSKYPTFTTHNHETKEGFSKPSFFVSIIPITNSNDSINFKSKAFTIVITYFQSKVDKIENMQKADEIIELFGYFITVNGRNIRVTDSDYELVGEKTNILQVSVNIEYLQANERTETSKVAQSLSLNEEKR